MPETYGITGYGAYVPRLRLERAAIAQAHRWMGASLASLGKGERAFCGWDEDAVTMAVEAARDCVPPSGRAVLTQLRLASTTFPYADLSNAVIVASALGLPASTRTQNEAGSQRAGVGSLLDALTATSGEVLVVASERPVAKPASAAEIASGAGAAAIRLGHDGVIATLRGAASRSAYFVDHFRASDRAFDYAWEERWVRDEGYAKLVPPTVADALADAGLQMAQVDRFVMASPIRGVAAATAKSLGFKGELPTTLDGAVGFCGAAHPLLMLSEALESAAPGEVLLLVGFGQGVDALVFQTTDAIAGLRPARGVSGAIADRLATCDYLRLLSFYGLLDLEWGMRAEKAGKAALTEQYRSADQLDDFTGGRCRACGTVQFPRLAYCANPACKAPASEQEPAPLADAAAQVFTMTADWLSYHPAPPLCVGFVQFDVGARLLMEVVDADPDRLEVGTRLRMVFRIKERDAIRGYNRYFWKATPLRAASAAAA